MNLVRGLILLALSTSFGYLLSLKFKKRRAFYSSFRDFNIKLKNEISFSRGSILKLLESIEIDNDFYNCTRCYFYNDTFSLGLNYLSDDDKYFINEYLKNIGFGDGNSQIKYLKNVGEDIDEKRLEALGEEKKYRKLYLKVGILVGIMLLVIVL